MDKSIKKSINNIIVIVCFVVLLLALLLFSLSIPRVQTVITNHFTRQISKELNSTITVGEMELRFFNKLIVKNLLIRDNNNDTLLYSEEVSAGIRRISTRNNTYSLGRVSFYHPIISLVTDSTGTMNLRWYLDTLRSGRDPSATKRDITITIGKTNIVNGEFYLTNNYRERKRKSKNSDTAIEFADMRLSQINGVVDEWVINGPDVSFLIDRLSFNERSGFHVNNMKSKMEIKPATLLFSETSINLMKSALTLDHIELKGDSITKFKDFTQNVRLDLIINDQSVVSSVDLKHFVPALEGFNEEVLISGQLRGPVSELRGRDIVVLFGENTKMDFDFDISGLPSLEDSYIHLGINNITTHPSDIEMIQLPLQKSITLPDFAHRAGTFSFDGNFTGFLTDFVAFGRLKSEHGSITTDASLKPMGKNTFLVNGLVRGINIDLGYLFDIESVGITSLSANLDGEASNVNKFSGNLTGTIDSLMFNDYMYHRISLNGVVSDKMWDGNINISDDNIDLNLISVINMNEEIPDFNFNLDLKKANLFHLKIDESDTTSALSMQVTADFKGSNIDNLEGELVLLNSTIERHSDTLEIDNFSLLSHDNEGTSTISLRTDYVDADIIGKRLFSEIGTLAKSIMASLIPSRFNEPTTSVSSHDDFTFNINFKNTDEINSFFETDLLIADESTIEGKFVRDSLLQVGSKSDMFSFKNFTFNDLSISANVMDTNLFVGINSSSLELPWKPKLNDFNIDLAGRPDTFDIDIKWDDIAITQNSALIQIHSYFLDSVGEAKPAMIVAFDSSNVYSNGNRWTIGNSFISKDSTCVSVNDFRVFSGDRYYLLDGKISEQPSDSLVFKLNDIDLSPVNKYTNPKGKKNPLPLNIKGLLSGRVALTDFYADPLIECNIVTDDFSIFDNGYGQLDINSVWNSTKDVIDIAISNNLLGARMIDAEGFYDPTLSSIDLGITTDKLPINVIQGFLDSFASNIQGTASGKVRLHGKLRNLILDGSLMPENSSLKVDYLQSTYNIEDSIRFNRDGILFRNVRLTDERNNTGRMNGYVHHRYFKDFYPDLSFALNNNMVLNLKAKDNEYFYGTATATGVATITRESSSTSISASAETGRNTRIFIPLNTGESMSDYSFVTFVSNDTLDDEKRDIPLQPTTRGTGIDLDLSLTPDAEIQLIFDSKAGDVMKVHGSGNLNISMKPRESLKVSGDYIIDKGDYLFTLGNILNKSFSVENGGKISFNGDINDAELDIQAIYTIRTSLFEILQDEKFNDRIPVECQLNITGTLLNPIIAFAIYLPNADEETRTYLNNIISTEEELSRQFLYLLVMNSFYSDPTYSTATETGTGTAAMAVTTTEMLSNQLSNWLSQISNDFDIGFVYRPGYKGINSQEVQVALSTQVLNDKVTINGNFDLSGSSDGTTSENTPITGDFDIEYKITERIRFKVFNRFNNPYTGRQADYTQGVGLFYRQEFNKFADLFKRKRRDKTSKKRETVVQEASEQPSN